MAEGHGRSLWEPVSVLCALIANVHRDPKKGRAFKPEDFDPYRTSGRDVIRMDDAGVEAMKAAFVGRKGNV